jgi:hypothetical protein
MDSETIREIVASVQRPWWLDDAGMTIAPEGWTEIRRELDDPVPLLVSTLSGLVAYAKANIDKHNLDELLLTVDSPVVASLRGAIGSEFVRFRRPVWIRASYSPTVGFNEYKDAETFSIWLQTGFAPSAGRDQVLQLVASIRENSVRETVDDGVTQEVKTGRGVTLVGMQAVPNPVLLSPFRTFTEVEQPSSLFVLRVRTATSREADRPELALFEADGGAWKREAMRRIGLYFQAELPEVRGIA